MNIGIVDVIDTIKLVRSTAQYSTVRYGMVQCVQYVHISRCTVCTVHAHRSVCTVSMYVCITKYSKHVQHIQVKLCKQASPAINPSAGPSGTVNLTMFPSHSPLLWMSDAENPGATVFPAESPHCTIEALSLFTSTMSASLPPLVSHRKASAHASSGNCCRRAGDVEQDR